MCGYLGKPEEGVRASGTGVTNGYEPPGLAGCWELSPVPLQEQQTLILLTAGPSWQPPTDGLRNRDPGKRYMDCGQNDDN